MAQSMFDRMRRAAATSTSSGMRRVTTTRYPTAEENTANVLKELERVFDEAGITSEDVRAGMRPTAEELEQKVIDDVNRALAEADIDRNTIIEAMEESGASSDSGEVMSQDVSGLPFEFNPPLHKANFHIRTQFGSSAEADLKEAERRYRQRDYTKGLSLENMAGLRLGRITMTDRVENFPLLGDKRWGFRFLFNPPQWGGGQVFNPNIIPDFGSDVPLVISAGLEVISFQILLDRVPDVLGQSVLTSDYLPEITSAQLVALKERGTNYDLEYLYRVSNVNLLDTKDDQNTADFGVLLPNICMLTLGNHRFRGRFTQVVANHVMFSPDMVPVRTEVAISFQRIAAMSEEDLVEYFEGGGTDIRGYKEGTVETTRGGSRNGAPMTENEEAAKGTVQGVPPAQTLTQAKVEEYARGAGFTSGQARIMAAIAMGESMGNTHAHNPVPPDNSYGLWQINMLGSMGPARRAEFGIGSNEELFNPEVNARAAKMIWDSQGYNAWSVYSSGRYRDFL